MPMSTLSKAFDMPKKTSLTSDDLGNLKTSSISLIRKKRWLVDESLDKKSVSSNLMKISKPDKSEGSRSFLQIGKRGILYSLFGLSFCK